MLRVKKNKLNIISILIILFGFFIYYYQIIDSTLLIALISSTITIYLGSLKLKIEHDLLFKELFLYFNEKYNNDLNDLINELKYDKNKEINNIEKSMIIDYFNLCAEEYLWYKKSRIPEDIWIAWKSGIIENINIRQINEIFYDEISSNTNVISYYGFIDEIKVHIISNDKSISTV